MKKRIATFNHQHFINIKNRDELTKQNVDVAIVVFTLHETNSDWILPKMKEILRLDGYGIIIDLGKFGRAYHRENCFQLFIESWINWDKY